MAHEETETFDVVMVGAGPSCMGFLFGFLQAVDQEESCSIAVIERGPAARSSHDTNHHQHEPHQQQHELVHRWFAAAHCTLNHSAHVSLLQGQVRHRVIDVPIGQGRGGGSNINACLCLPPCASDFANWPTNFGAKVMMDSVQTVYQSLVLEGTLAQARVKVGTTQDDNETIVHNENTTIKSMPCTTLWRTLPCHVVAPFAGADRSHLVPSEPSFPSWSKFVPYMAVPYHAATKQKSRDQMKQQPNVKDNRYWRRTTFYDGLVAPLLEKKNDDDDDDDSWWVGRTRPNIQIRFLTEHQAERLLIAGNQIQGVECSSCISPTTTVCPNKRTKSTASEKYTTIPFRRILAREQVILCAGAIETPLLLLVSGIGRPADLAACQLTPARSGGAYNYKGAVGEHLRDHVVLPRAILTRTKRHWQASAKLSVDQLYHEQLSGKRFQIAVMDPACYPDALPYCVASLLRYRWDRSDRQQHGLLASFMVALFNLLAEFVFRLVHMLLQVLMIYTPIYYFVQSYVSTVTIHFLNPSSQGKIRLKPRTVQDQSIPCRRSNVQPMIDLAYVQDSNDVESLLSGWRASDKIVQAIGGWCELFPGPLIRSFGWNRNHRTASLVPLNGPLVTTTSSTLQSVVDPTRWRLFAQSACLPYYHWCGTCAMPTLRGDIDDWVVDVDLRVREFERLRICDASVFPSTISAPTALSCAALGNRFGTMFARERKHYKTD